MIKALLRKKTPATWVAAAGERIYAVGDVHGCLAQLVELVARIDADDAGRPAARTTLILLGDLIDRGPDSAGAVEYVRRLVADRDNVRLIAGNHEEIMLGALGGDQAMLKLFAQFGGRETMLSYGMSEREWQDCDWDALVERANALVPANHLALLGAAEDYVVCGDYLFVHAGIRPGTPLAEQRQADFRWIRNSFLQHRESHGHMVVHGHTISEGVDDRWNRIGIDTGCYTTGVLTAVGIEADQRWYLSARG